MFICLECELTFDEPEKIYPFETVCPHCSGAYEEAEECEECAGLFPKSEIENGLCYQCRKEK